jgi:predicted flap endonuclease-1-like 5' DNA nuclease
VSPAQAPHDLTVIDGIGPKIATVLEDAGIRSLQDLAGTAPDRLRELLAERGVRFAPSLVTWPDQAQRLIAGAV